MRKSWSCLGVLVTFTVIQIYFNVKQSPVSCNVSPMVVRRNNADDNTDRISIREYQAVYARWSENPGPSAGVKVILYWNKMKPSYRNFMFGIGDRFKDCRIPHCYGTPDRNLLPNALMFDAIMFHGIEMNLSDRPIRRLPHQRFIFFLWESPQSRPINNAKMVLQPNFYNWTMSYRLDSDIIRPYARIKDIKTGNFIAPPRLPDGIVPWVAPEFTLYVPSDEEMLIIKGKSLMSAWFVSHCNTTSKREIIAQRLSQHVQVDIYGECASLQCEPESEKCYELVEKDYFFYLSFENTRCKDYVTEKLFEILRRYVIPIVYGGADYSKFAPPHSYIDVNDFESVHQLAIFLRALSENPKQYASYFWWKKYYQVEMDLLTETTLCDLCEKLHAPNLPRKSIENFEQYYNGVDQCYSAKLPI